MEFFRSINPVWVSLGPVLIINILLTTSLLYFLATRKGRPVPEDMKTRHNSKFLSSTLKHWWYWNNMPIAKFFVRLKMTPNSLTFIGFLFSIAASFFFAKGIFGIAGWLMLFGATFDLFDGQVARLTGKVSKSGAFFDSVMDRFSEGLIFFGLAFYFRDSWALAFIIAGLIGSMGVSYTRARGEAVGVEVKKGSMQRPERIVYIGCSSIFQPLLSYFFSLYGWTLSPVLVVAALVLVGVMTNVTAVYRMLFVMNVLDSKEKKSEETTAQFLSQLSNKEGRKILLLKNRYGYDRSRAQFRLCILLMLDGAHPSVLFETAKRGKLPNIARLFFENGVVNEAVSVFPSATGPALIPFVTGCFPGTANVPGIRWFDRTVPQTKKIVAKRFRDYFGLGAYALDSDLSKEVRTIFEYSKQAYNILGMVNRGCGFFRDPAFLSAPYLFYKVKKQARMEVVEQTALRWFETALKRETDFIFYNFPTIDLMTHETHKSHHRVIGAYQRFDKHLGQMIQQLQKTGLFEETFWILSSDHGHFEVSNHFDLDAFLEKKYSTLYFPKSFRKWEEANAVNMVTGNGMSHIYLRLSQNWERCPCIEELVNSKLIEELLDQPEVDLLMGRSSEGGVRVLSHRGEALMVEDGNGLVHYHALRKDPFGFETLPSVMSREELLQRTANTLYPDAILQALQIFRSRRTGDLVLSASLGADFRDRFEKPPHQSGHGSLNREHMMVPFYVSPKISFEPPPYRTADIFATVLEVMGIVPTHAVEGRKLITLLPREARDEAVRYPPVSH